MSTVMSSTTRGKHLYGLSLDAMLWAKELRGPPRDGLEDYWYPVILRTVNELAKGGLEAVHELDRDLRERDSGDQDLLPLPETESICKVLVKVTEPFAREDRFFNPWGHDVRRVRERVIPLLENLAVYADQLYELQYVCENRHGFLERLHELESGTTDWMSLGVEEDRKVERFESLGKLGALPTYLLVATVIVGPFFQIVLNWYVIGLLFAGSIGVWWAVHRASIKARRTYLIGRAHHRLPELDQWVGKTVGEALAGFHHGDSPLKIWQNIQGGLDEKLAALDRRPVKSY